MLRWSKTTILISDNHVLRYNVLRFSRLDAMYLNAGIMPTNGIDFATIFKPDLANAIDVFTTGGNVCALHGPI